MESSEEPIPMEQEKSQLKNKKRNIWTLTEVRYFLSLIKEKQVEGLMDGKRLRVSDIFKTLVNPMKQQGFVRDANQLIVKYKNLKAEYQKCKRHNSISGNSPMYFDFYEEMDTLLGQRPISLSQDEFGVESLSEIPTIDENDQNITQDTIDITIEDLREAHTEIPGSSKASDTQKKKKVTKVMKEDPYVKLIKEMEETRKQESEKDKKLLSDFVMEQKNTMMACTEAFLSGLKEILSDRNSRNSDSE